MTKPFAVPLAVTLAMAQQMNLPSDALFTLPADEGTWLFQSWGDIYGTLLAGLLRAGIGAEEAVTPINEVCLHTSLRRVPPLVWNGHAVRRTLQILWPELEESLGLGRFHSLLPPSLAVEIVDGLIDRSVFERLVRNAVIQPVPAQVRMPLLELAG